MAWQRESHHINMAEGEHVIRLVNPNVKDADGQPVRHLLKIRMGAGAFEYSVGSNAIHVKLGGDFTVDENGELIDSAGNVFDPRHFEKELLSKLNDHHDKLNAYAQRHNVPKTNTGTTTR